MNNTYMIFLDFDGTITENDVGYEMFKRFTRDANEPLVQAYRRGEMNSLNCLSGECDIWNSSSVNQAEVLAYLDSRVLRGGIEEFLTELGRLGIKPLILSEGFDFYIDRILAVHNLADLERITNIAHFENGLLRPEFPYHGLGCRECSNCKGYHIRRLRPPNMCAVYIGDGHSDFHASLASDIIFARSHLSELLGSTKRQFLSYNNFYDITESLKGIMKSGLFTQGERIGFYRFSERNRKSIEMLWENGAVMRFVGYPNGLGWSQEQYDRHWQLLLNDKEAIHLSLEDGSGRFLGEAKIAFPDRSGLCQPDLKLLPEYWGQGLGFEAWQSIMERTLARWPEAGILVTPNIENENAIRLYSRLGFEFDGGELLREPLGNDIGAVPISYRRMIKKGVASAGDL